MEMMLDQKQIQAIFLFKFKMGCKAAFGPGTANECTSQWLFKKFCKGDEPWRWGAQRPAIGSWQLRAIIKADPLITIQNVAQEPNINHSTVIWHLKQIGKVKTLSKWVPHELSENQKNRHFEVSSSLTLCNNNKLFLNWIVMWDEKWIIWQPVRTSSAAGPKNSSKAPPKAKLTPKKGSWSLFGGLLLVWSTTTFWFLEKPWHLRTALSKLMRCTENCNAYSQHWSTKWAQFSVTTPNPMLHNQCFKSWTNWAKKFCLICHIHLTSRQLIPLLQASQQLWGKGKHFHNQQKAENAFQEFVKSWGMDFYATGINKLISHWQKCVDSNGSYSD